MSIPVTNDRVYKSMSCPSFEIPCWLVSCCMLSNWGNRQSTSL